MERYSVSCERGGGGIQFNMRGGGEEGEIYGVGGMKGGDLFPSALRCMEMDQVRGLVENTTSSEAQSYLRNEGGEICLPSLNVCEKGKRSTNLNISKPTNHISSNKPIIITTKKKKKKLTKQRVTDAFFPKTLPPKPDCETSEEKKKETKSTKSTLSSMQEEQGQQEEEEEEELFDGEDEGEEAKTSFPLPPVQEDEEEKAVDEELTENEEKELDQESTNLEEEEVEEEMEVRKVKVLKERTFLDERGYLVTENVWEEEEVMKGVGKKRSAPEPKPNPIKKPPNNHKRMKKGMNPHKERRSNAP